jgi:plastocyanin
MHMVIAATLLALAAACVPATSPKIDGAPEVVVTASEMQLAPDSIVLPASVVNVTFRNDGEADHDLTVEALGLRLVARPGETVTAGLRDLKPGRYDGYCSILGHAMAGMRMTVTVR